MTRPIATLACACLWTAAVSTMAHAQRPLRLSGGPTLSHMRVHSETATASETLSASEMGFEATAAFRRLALRVRYAQANLSPSDTVVLAREAAGAELALTGQVLPWLQVGAGVRRRTYDTEPSQQRWTMWEALAAAELPIFKDVVTGSAELRGTLAASVDEPGGADPWNRGYAGEVGMRVALPRIPVWLRFGYRLEIQKLAGGARREVVDGLTVFVGVGPR